MPDEVKSKRTPEVKKKKTITANIEIDAIPLWADFFLFKIYDTDCDVEKIKNCIKTKDREM